jgi:hypothetical protein
VNVAQFTDREPLPFATLSMCETVFLLYDVKSRSSSASVFSVKLHHSSIAPNIKSISEETKQNQFSFEKVKKKFI